MLSLILGILALAIAITIHEAAHAWMADRLGDPTARVMGRLTLNPLAHYDPVGTTMLLLLVVGRALGMPVIPFGWAKPVPVDAYNLKNKRRDVALVSLAGPAVNLLFATILAILMRFIQNDIFFILALQSILLNVSLAIFNLVPIHPLDGGKILAGLLEEKDARIFDAFVEKYGILILFMLIFPVLGGESFIGRVISPVIGIIIKLLVPSASMI